MHGQQTHLTCSACEAGWGLQACLDIDPAKRLTCSELLRLPYLTGVEGTIPATILKAQVTMSCTPTSASEEDSPDLSWRHPWVIPCISTGLVHKARSTVQCCVQEKASEERDVVVKLRRQKRKSADMEAEAAARPVFHLTATAHASQPDAPRCAIRICHQRV